MQTANEIHAPSNIGMHDLPRLISIGRNGRKKFLTKRGLTFNNPFVEMNRKTGPSIGGFKPAFHADDTRIEFPNKKPNIFKRIFKRVFRNQNR